MLNAVHVVEVLLGPEHKRLGARKISYSFGKRIVMTVPVVMVRLLLAGDLLLEQRAQDDRCGAGVLELLYVVQIVAQR